MSGSSRELVHAPQDQCGCGDQHDPARPAPAWWSSKCGRKSELLPDLVSLALELLGPFLQMQRRSLRPTKTIPREVLELSVKLAQPLLEVCSVRIRRWVTGILALALAHPRHVSGLARRCEGTDARAGKDTRIPAFEQASSTAAGRGPSFIA